jgi:hypothetical protein
MVVTGEPPTDIGALKRVPLVVLEGQAVKDEMRER